jgi:hypothetical protein
VRADKRHFSVVKSDVSPNPDRRSPNSQSEKTNGVERRSVRRPNKFKSDSWYGTAALSITIKRSAPHET